MNCENFSFKFEDIHVAGGVKKRNNLHVKQNLMKEEFKEITKILWFKLLKLLIDEI